MSRSTVARLVAELDRAADRGTRIDLWWRDDDAVSATPALDRLTGLSARTGLPVALATVPEQVEASLVEHVERTPALRVLVHGRRHENRAPDGEKPAEFGPHRPMGELARDARAGLAAVRRRFGSRARPVFVPPWNRVGRGLLPLLPDLGYAAFSGFGTPGRSRDGGLVRIDTHLDPVDWRGSRSLASAETLLIQVRAALATPAPVLGLLTHALVFDEPLWSFCEAFLAAATNHPAVEPRTIDAFLCSETAPSRVDAAVVLASGTAIAELAS